MLTGDDLSLQYDGLRRALGIRHLILLLVHIHIDIGFARRDRLFLDLDLFPLPPPDQIRSSRPLHLVRSRRPGPFTPFGQVHPPSLFQGEDLFHRFLRPGVLGLDGSVGGVLEG